MLENGALHAAIKDGGLSVLYTKLVAWLTDQLRSFTHLEEQVNAITGGVQLLKKLMNQMHDLPKIDK